MVNYNLVKSWMKVNYVDYIDCGEIQCTQLAEAAADNFDIYEDAEYTIPEKVYDLAVDVASELNMLGPMP